MKITRAVVPSLFTTLNIFCGFMSFVNATDGKFQVAAWFIILAAIFDSLDGVMARITRSSSQFGVELDSLADVVSFGAAPSFLAYQSYLREFGSVGILISSLPLIFGAIRLARFNVQLVGFDKEHFKGLPIPMQAMTLCAFVLQNYTEGYGYVGWSKDLLAPLVIGLSLLMVSRIKYDTLPKLSRKGLVAHPWMVVSILAGGLTVLFSKGEYLFLVLMAFILFGVLRAGMIWFRKTIASLDKDQDEENEISSIDI
jgi:CDP-diacylglycerol--serine O-phosphatidyltransferase